MESKQPTVNKLLGEQTVNWSCMVNSQISDKRTGIGDLAMLGADLTP